MFIKDFCKSTNVSIWQIFFRKIYSRLREYKNNICVSEITEKRSQQNSRFSTFEKLAFRSSNSPIWDWWMWNDCDKCCQTWLWLRKMLPWIPLSISAKNPHGSPQGNPHLLLKVKDWYLEKSIRNLSNFTDSSTYFTPLSRPPRRNSLRSSSKIYSVSFQVSYFGVRFEWQFWILRILCFFRIVAVFFMRLQLWKQKTVGEMLRILMRGPWILLSLKFQDLLIILIVRIRVATMMTKTKSWTPLTRHVSLQRQKAGGSWVRGMHH